MSRAIQEARVAQRARVAAARRRRTTAAAAVTTVLAVVATMVLVKVGQQGPKKATVAAASTAAPASLVTAVASVPPTTIDTVGAGSATSPTAVNGAALTQDGKPRVVYVGAEWCPYCAAERWAVVQALSRFGTFTGLGQTASASDDVYPGTATLSFHGGTYTSPYLGFSGYETQDGSHRALDTPPADVESVFETQGGGSFPFVDLGGTSIITGASYDPGLLRGLTQAQVVAAIADPTTAVSKAVVGEANRITARLCALTGGQPAAVCSAAGVRAAS